MTQLNLDSRMTQVHASWSKQAKINAIFPVAYVINLVISKSCSI
jgi:hypothetical protein